MDIDKLDSDREIEQQHRPSDQRRDSRQDQIAAIALQVDARVQAWAEERPDAVVGVWRRGHIVETNPFNPTTGKPITARELARYTVVMSDGVDDEVFAFCDKHQTAFSAPIQSAARNQIPEQWCPGCATDPASPSGVTDPAVAVAERAAKRAVQGIDRIKSSRNNRITKTTQIAAARGVITETQAQELLAIWQEL